MTRNDVESFMEITGSTEESAIVCLIISGNNLNDAIEFFFSHDGQIPIPQGLNLRDLQLSLFRDRDDDEGQEEFDTHSASSNSEQVVEQLISQEAVSQAAVEDVTAIIFPMGREPFELVESIPPYVQSCPSEFVIKDRSIPHLRCTIGSSGLKIGDKFYGSDSSGDIMKSIYANRIPQEFDDCDLELIFQTEEEHH